MGILSRYIQKVRIAKVLPYVRGAVLDLGCGDARILTLAGDRVESYCGVEADLGHVETLRRRFPEQKFVAGDVEKDALGFEKTFDTVLMIALVEHIRGGEHLFGQAVKGLRDGGRIVITTPTIWGDRVHTMGAYLGLFARSAVKHHVKIYKRGDFDALARNFGLKIEEYKTFEWGCNQLVVMGRRG